MSPLRRDDLRVGLCPGRLAIARYRRAPLRRLIESAMVPVSGEPSAELARLAAGARVSVVLSNHFVRYALLPWTPTLRTEDDWAGYARHSFTSTYAEAARRWEVRTCSTGFRQSRLACAVDSSLLGSVGAIRSVISIQPYLMSAFNARRRRLRRGTAWFVLQEEDRLTIALIAGGTWKLVRSRHARGDWRAALPELLDRETAAAAEHDCGQVLVCADSEAPPQLGRYRLTDLTLPAGAAPEARAASMVLS